jgi:exodeoxyribonuclease VII large subunit
MAGASARRPGDVEHAVIQPPPVNTLAVEADRGTSLVNVALQTTAEKPAPVRVIANAVSTWIDRLGPVWVEGQIAQLTRRPTVVWLTLRDPLAEVSVSVSCRRDIFDSLPVPPTEGARVVVHAKFSYYLPRGTLSLVAREIRPVGTGELLARIEQRRQLLAAEGLFEAARKKRLPFLPRRIGLITGRESAAERDVLDNARRRWPGVDFRVENTAVQGYDAARQVIDALSRLDKDPSIDVIVVARGGGALEDLLPFSDEGLVRTVAGCRTPVVSAIGHEEDQPLLDLVADLRASTPTDAAKRIVPDVREEVQRVHATRDRGRYALDQMLRREQYGLSQTRSRPVLSEPQRVIDQASAVVADLVARSRRTLDHRLERAVDDLDHRLARVRALSPLATLERGYAVLQTASDDVLTSADQVSVGDTVRARLARGRLELTVNRKTDDQTRSPDGRHAHRPT